MSMDLRVIAQAGRRRANALKQADEALDTIADALIAAGDGANVKLAAELAGVSRSALYDRMHRRRVEAPR